MEGYLDDLVVFGALMNQYVLFVFIKVLFYLDETDSDLVTVLACDIAFRLMLRPLITFNGKVHIASRFNGINDLSYLSVNNLGVMDNKIFTKSMFHLFLECYLVAIDGKTSTRNSQMHVVISSRLLCSQTESHSR